MILIYISLKKIVDPKTGDEKPVTISVDDGIRPNTTVADLAKLKPVFKKDGSTTAGNLGFCIAGVFINCGFQTLTSLYCMFRKF